MSEVGNLFLSALGALSAQAAATVTIDGHSYAGTANALRSQVEVSEGGPEKLPRISFTLAVADFTTPGRPLPVEDQGVTWGARLLRVDEVLVDPTQTLLTLRCKASTR